LIWPLPGPDRARWTQQRRLQRIFLRMDQALHRSALVRGSAR